ncbi:cytochrome b561 [Paraburkholderia bannensis]|uniref:Cytochrome b561 n=1 Tax=Paraburkholderia bannensis TaxID=765414 RepID=A0A7W9TYK0_9BURK|nr:MULTISPECIES: cytochrome b [Paraburkholderia]MBB3257552.1 cytochrome b561 [Paraburkholderia sp. WP4_3_2]MBB6102565.1 cytochrome b561 [Paraburkholderia bannensis]
MKTVQAHFCGLARLLHWSMAVLIVAMLFVGVGMVSTVSRLHNSLIALHRPLGIALLVLAIVRIVVRLTRGTPAMPNAMPAWQRVAAHASHLVLYALMIAMPLIGWAMLSAAGYPVVLAGALHLPPITPPGVALYAFLRAAHTWLAMLLFATVLLHLGAALFHGLIRRDGVLESMARS